MSRPLMLYTDSNFVSPYAMSVFVALAVKDVPFEMTLVDLDRSEQHEPGYIGLSLTGKVPALVHDDFALAESSAIIEYVDEVFPGPALYPHEPRQRARARQIQAWLRTDLAALRAERASEILFNAPVRPLPALTAPARQAADKLLRVAGQLMPPEDKNLFGIWGIADFELAFMLRRLVAGGDPVPQRLVDFVQEQWGRSAVQRWVGLNERQRV